MGPKKQGSAKCIWLITYSVGSPNIAAPLLHDVGIPCDECHTVAWRESKYTLLHLERKHRARLSAMSRSMARMEARGIRSSSITGYETLSSNDDEGAVQDHPGFRRIVELYSAQSPELESWTKAGKTMLRHFVTKTDARSMTRAELIRRVVALAPLAPELARVRAENENLASILGMRAEELASAHSTIDTLMARNEELYRRLSTKMDECQERIPA